MEPELRIACEECGEEFDDIAIAREHETSDGGSPYGASYVIVEA